MIHYVSGGIRFRIKYAWNRLDVVVWAIARKYVNELPSLFCADIFNDKVV